MRDLILVIGSTGQLGSDLLHVGRQRGYQITGLSRPDIDVSDRASVDAALDRLAPKVVINTVAAHGAELYHASDQRPFFDLNALGPWHLAQWCNRHGATLVHYSTDYVYGAEAARARLYQETDLPCPTNVYGASKAAGELLVQSFCLQHFVLRVAGLYGITGCRAKNNSNFVKMTLQRVRQGEDMRVVNDQVLSPTWTVAAAAKMYDMLDAGAPFGLYHLAGAGACTWYDLACEVVRLSGGKIAVSPETTPPDAPEAMFRRPRYTALDNAALRAAGLGDLPDWRESLAQYVAEEARGG